MLVELASTPVAAGLFFLYIKDKYEKEPWKMLFLGVLFGLYTAAVVYALGSFLEERFPHEETPFYTAFFSSAGVEEAVKFLFCFFSSGATATSMSRLTGLYTAYLFRSALPGRRM